MTEGQAQLEYLAMRPLSVAVNAGGGEVVRAQDSLTLFALGYGKGFHGLIVLFGYKLCIFYMLDVCSGSTLAFSSLSSWLDLELDELLPPLLSFRRLEPQQASFLSNAASQYSIIINNIISER